MKRVIGMWHAAWAMIDFCGKDGRVSFTKLVVATLIIAELFSLDISAAKVLIFVAAAFGRSTVSQLISRSTMQVEAREMVTKVIERVKARRDPERGMDPAAADL